MFRAGGPANHVEAIWQTNLLPDLRRAAQDGQHRCRVARHDGDLVHDAARCADDVVLRLLTQGGQAKGVDVDA